MGTNRYVMALDQGTTSSRAILYRMDGSIAGVEQEEFRQIYPRSGWVEHDAEEIWATQQRVLHRVLESSGVGAADVAALGITNQRETIVVWERATGKPIHHAVVWQCRRTAKVCSELEASGAGDLIAARTGLVIDAYFSGTKIAWVLDHVSGARARAARGELLAGTVDSWLVWKLTGGKTHVMDVTNASRTMLLDVDRLCWDEELLALLRVPREVLPSLVPSSGVVAEAHINGVDIPIAGVAGDQQSALFGQGCWSRGHVKNTYGTGCFVLMNTGEERVASSQRLLSTVAWQIDGRTTYALEGSVFMGGAVIQWLRDELGLLADAAESETVAASVEDSGGVCVVPAFTGLGAPHWEAEARGIITGLSRGTGRAHIVRASLESIAMQCKDVIDAIVRDAGPLTGLRVDGGASRNNLLMQLQADLLGTEVLRPADVETTARGAALLAGLGVGVWRSLDELPVDSRKPECFSPARDETWRRRRVEAWEKAVRTTLAWARD